MMRTTGKTSRGGRGSAHLIRVALGIIGFLLSPLTPWNDPFVNLPLTIALSVPLSRLLPRQMAYALAYAFTNVLGIALLVVAKNGVSINKRDVLKSLIWGVVGYAIYLILMNFLSA